MSPDHWPFDEPRNVAVFTVRGIVRDGRPILRVSHDEDDGGWQFLEWDTPAMADAMLVSLQTVYGIDATIGDLADLPLRWRAWRTARGRPWQRAPQPPEAGET